MIKRDRIDSDNKSEGCRCSAFNRDYKYAFSMIESR